MMKKEYNAMFERLAPQKSDEELLRAVFDGKVEKPMRKKTSKKAVLIPAIAMAVICSTTVAVSAANGWNLPTAIRELFNEDNSDGGAFFGYDINGIGSKKLDQSVERDGYTVNMVGTVAEKNTTYLLYDIVVDNGHVFRNNVDMIHTYSADDTVDLTILLPHKSLDPIIKRYIKNDDTVLYNQMNTSGAENILISQEDNVYHCATRYDVKPLSLEGEELTFELHGLNINSLCFEADDVCDTITVKYDFIKDSKECLIDVNKQFEFDGDTYTLEFVNLTQLSVYLRITQTPGEYLNNDQVGEYCDKFKAIRENIKLRLKDGSTTDADMIFTSESHGGNADTKDYKTVYSDIHLMWKRPVNVADIESVTIGDTTFTLS